MTVVSDIKRTPKSSVFISLKIAVSSVTEYFSLCNLVTYVFPLCLYNLTQCLTKKNKFKA